MDGRPAAGKLEHPIADYDVRTAKIRAGINTNPCVMCAAFESQNRDLKTIVVADCVHTMFGDDLHWFGLQNIARSLGWVVSLDDLMEKVTANVE